MQKRKTGTTRKVQVLKPEIGATALADAKATIADYLLAQIPKKTAGKHKDCLEAATIQACLGRLPMSQLEDMAGFLKITQMNEFGKTAEALKMLNPRLDLSVKEIEGKGRRKPYVAVKFITPDGELRESDFDLARLDGTIKLQVAVG